MRRICSYCEKFLGDFKPYESNDISHGMCEECAAYFLNQWQGLKLDQFLDEFNEPILAVDKSTRIIAANKPMKKFLNKNDDEIRGFRGGEIMLCQYSRLSGGCGNTTHCHACTIRKTVTYTLETGQPKKNEPAYLNQDDKRIEFIISTELKEEYVILRIEEVVSIESHKNEPDVC